MSDQTSTEGAAAAVIIPHYNDVARLERCLAALVRENDAAALAKTEIVVVDNNSTDDIAAIRAAYGQVRFVIEETPGAASARNRGVAETTAERLFFLDADCVPASDWLATAHAVAGDADLVGGRIDTFDETLPPRSGAEAFEAVFAFHQRDYIERQRFSVTANLLTTRTIFEDVGPFVAGVSEDLDWCRRAVGKGYGLVYRDGLAVEHPTRPDWPALQKKWRRLASESFQLTGATPAARIKWLLRSVAVAGSAFVHAPKILFSDKLNGLTERLRGLGALFRLRFWRALVMLRQATTGS